MSLFALDRKNSRHLQAVEKQLYSVRIHPTTTPSQKVIKSMSPEGGTYASKVRIHVFELLRDSNSNLPTQNEICTLVCKLATMTQSTYNDPDYYTSVEGLERRAIEDWEKVHGKTDHTTEAAAKIPAVAVNKWHKAAATRKLNATQRLAKQQRAEAKKNEKGVGKKRAGAVGRKPARSPEKKSLVGCDGQNGLGLDIPPAPCGNPSSEEGCSAQDAQGRSKKKAKVAADPRLAFEQSMNEMKRIWEEQQKLMLKMAHAIAACNENAELMQARVTEREEELEVQHEKTLAESKAKLQHEARKAMLREMMQKIEDNEESGEEYAEGDKGENMDGDGEKQEDRDGDGGNQEDSDSDSDSDSDKQEDSNGDGEKRKDHDGQKKTGV